MINENFHAQQKIMSEPCPLLMLGMAGVVIEAGIGGVCLPMTEGEVYEIDGVSLEVLSEALPAGVYHVSAIIGHRVRRGCSEFLTVYKGYEDAPSWQPLADFVDGGRVTNEVLLCYLSVKGL